jgi:hypothetical protein
MLGLVEILHHNYQLVSTISANNSVEQPKPEQAQGKPPLRVRDYLGLLWTAVGDHLLSDFLACGPVHSAGT